MYIYIYSITFFFDTPCISVTWVISMHQRAGCCFIQLSNMFCKETILRLVMPKLYSDDYR